MKPTPPQKKWETKYYKTIQMNENNVTPKDQNRIKLSVESMVGWLVVMLNPVYIRTYTHTYIIFKWIVHRLDYF